MNVEIIAVGNEIVTGKTVNTNATYIARQLQSIGLTPLYHSAVIDNKKQIESALQIALGRSEVILFIGGLGPTEDDLTKETICEYLNKPLILYKDLLEKIERHFIRLKKIMPKNNVKQALFPEDCEVIPNPNGTAPGGLIEYQGKYIIFLPGPPKELIPTVDEFVVPYFEKKVEGAYYIQDIKLFGIGESQMAEMIPDLLGDFGDIEVAPYVGNYEIVVRIKSFDKNKEEAKIKAEEIQKKVCNRLEEYIIGYNDNKLEEIILELLKTKNYTIATAESCTGGMLAGTLVNCSGISSYFKEGVVSYSNEAKQKYLGVKATTLDQYGAVSEETAREMAEGIKKAAGTHIGLSTTGIAGPDGGTQEKPVGLVYAGIAINDETYVYKFNFNGNRQGIREKTVKNLLYQLLKKLGR